MANCNCNNSCKASTEPIFAKIKENNDPRSYEIRTLVDGATGDKFFAKTHTKAVVNNEGDTIDSLLQIMDSKIDDLSQAVYALNPGEIKIKDDLYTDTAYYALSARCGYKLNKLLEDIKSELDTLKLLNDRTNKLVRIFTNFITPLVSISADDWRTVTYIDGEKQLVSKNNLSNVLLRSQIVKNGATPIKVKWNVSNSNNKLYINKYVISVTYKKYGKNVTEILFDGSPVNLPNLEHFDASGAFVNEIIGYITPDEDATEVNAKVTVIYGDMIEYSGESKLYIKDEYDFTSDFNAIGHVDYLGYEHMDEVHSIQKLNYPCEYYLPSRESFIKLLTELDKANCEINPGLYENMYLVPVDLNVLYFSLKQANDGVSSDIRYFFLTSIKDKKYWVEIKKNGELLVMNINSETEFESVNNY